MSYRALAFIIDGKPGIPIQLERNDGFNQIVPTNRDGYALFASCPESPWDVNIHIHASGYEGYDYVLSAAIGGPVPAGNHQLFVGAPSYPLHPPFDILLPPLVPLALPRLHVEGVRFVTDQGVLWRMAFADSFRLYERYLRNEDIRPVLQELKGLKANGVRVLGSFDFGTPQAQRLYPREHPDYFQRMPGFFNVLEDFSMYAEWCAFADTKRSVPGAADQTQFWGQTCDVFRPITNVLLQRVNEENQHENGVDGDTPKPAGICSSFGSNGTGDDPPLPFWDFCDLGSERRGDFALSTTTVNFAIKGYPGEGVGGGFIGTNRATVVSEPPGFADVSSGNRTNNPVIAYQLGIGAATWGAGGTAHSDCGVQSVMLTAIQKLCVSEFLRGIWAV